jgi:hypothetical protein
MKKGRSGFHRQKSFLTALIREVENNLPTWLFSCSSPHGSPRNKSPGSSHKDALPPLPPASQGLFHGMPDYLTLVLSIPPRLAVAATIERLWLSISMQW